MVARALNQLLCKDMRCEDGHIIPWNCDCNTLGAWRCSGDGSEALTHSRASEIHLTQI